MNTSTTDGRAARRPPRRVRSFFAPAAALMAVLAAALTPDPATAQGLPFNGVMPNVGAMGYDLMVGQSFGPQRMRMTGYASSKGGMVRWVHCQQPSHSPLRLCQLMVDGKVGGRFPLPATADLAQWMALSSGYGWVDRMGPDDGMRGSFESSGSFRVGAWNARGRFRYWR